MPVPKQKSDNRPLFPGSTIPQIAQMGCVLQEIPPYGQYYTYASGPKLAALDRPKYKGTGKPKGAHDYHSLMWDPRIYRGTTYKTFKTAEHERCKKNSLEEASISDKKRKKGAKRGLQLQQLGGIVRPKTPPQHSDKIGLEDMGIQTEKFLEEITDEVQEKDMCTQTDQLYDVVIPTLFCPIKTGLDVSTQINPWELFKFDEEAKPIVSSVVSKIIEQALFETMEEVELESLLAQQRQYEERHRMELMRLKRLQEREQRVTDERTRLIEQRRKEVEEEKATEARIGAALYATDYLTGFANVAVDDLRKEGYMIESKGLEEAFIPWLQKTTIKKFDKNTSAIALLDDIIQQVVEEREAEVADGIWREISAQNDLYQKYLPGDSDAAYFSNTPYSGYEAEEDE